jgi:hypothetical protein
MQLLCWYGGSGASHAKEAYGHVNLDEVRNLTCPLLRCLTNVMGDIVYSWALVRHTSTDTE